MITKFFTETFIWFQRYLLNKESSANISYLKKLEKEWTTESYRNPAKVVENTLHLCLKLRYTNTIPLLLEMG